MPLKCTLCSSDAEPFYLGKNGRYYFCGRCKGIFLSPEAFLGPEEEKERYKKHCNDIEDNGYQTFVSPIVNGILSSFSPQHLGLDFGCGQDSVIGHMLQKEGYNTEVYDPFFKEDKSVLSKKYDFIACCEVIEHFHNPGMEFKLLSSMLKPGGRLYCMTDLYTEVPDFEDWYYKNDNTHVFFYRPETIRYIKKNFGFDSFRIEKRLITFDKAKTDK